MRQTWHNLRKNLREFDIELETTRDNQIQTKTNRDKLRQFDKHMDDNKWNRYMIASLRTCTLLLLWWTSWYMPCLSFCGSKGIYYSHICCSCWLGIILPATRKSSLFAPWRIINCRQTLNLGRTYAMKPSTVTQVFFLGPSQVKNVNIAQICI